MKIKVIDGQLSTQSHSSELLNLNKILETFEGENFFPQKNFRLRFSDDEEKEVDRHRREIHLLTQRLKPTSKTEKATKITPGKETYLNEAKRDMSAHKSSPNLIRISPRNTGIDSARKFNAKRQRRANICKETKTPFCNRSQKTFTRALKASVPNRSAIWVRAPSGGRIGGEAERRIKIDNENYEDNVIENGVGSYRNNMKFPLSILNGYRSNIKKFTTTLSSGKSKDTKNFPITSKNFRKNCKRFAKIPAKKEEQVDSYNSSLEFKGFNRCKKVYLSMTSKQKFTRKRKGNVLKVDKKIFHFYTRHMKKSLLSPFKFKKILQNKKNKNVRIKLSSNARHFRKFKNLMKNNFPTFNDTLGFGKFFLDTNENYIDTNKIKTSNLIDKKKSKRSLLPPQDVACPSITFPIEPQNQNKVYVLEKEFTVFVKDINDNIPKFSQEIFEMSIRENGKAGKSYFFIHFLAVHFYF